MTFASSAPTGPVSADTDEKRAITEELGLARRAFNQADKDFRHAQRVRAAWQALVLSMEQLFFALPSDRQPGNERKIDAARKAVHQAREDLVSLGAEVRRTP